MTTSSKGYLKLAEHYRSRLQEHGDGTLGMDWPRRADNLVRFRVMTDLFALDVAAGKKVRVLDFGCGTSHYYEYLRAKGLSRRIEYTGLDIVPESVVISRKKFPRNRYLCTDVLANDKPIGQFDYIVMNGVFTQKRGMTEREMQLFLRKILTRLYPCFRRGLAFNTMSDQVDFKRRGAFHLNLDQIAKMLTRDFSRHFVVRHDYGLYENMFYLFKKEQR